METRQIGKCSCQPHLQEILVRKVWEFIGLPVTYKTNIVMRSIFHHALLKRIKELFKRGFNELALLLFLVVFINFERKIIN